MAMADPNTAGSDKRTGAHLAAFANSPPTLFLLLEAQADIHVKGQHRETPLHFAAIHESISFGTLPSCLQLLVDRRANVHVQGAEGETALQFAAVNERIHLVKQVANAGADALAQDAEGDIPLLWAYQEDTRAALMDGCWRISFRTLFQMNVGILCVYASDRLLGQLCRSLRRLVFVVGVVVVVVCSCCDCCDCCSC